MSRTIAKSDWHPASWQAFPASQQAAYPDKNELDRVVAELSRLPPITTSWEVDALKAHIALAQRGEAFVLQGGDCAETFDECTSENIVAKLKILLQMSLVLTWGARTPVVRVGREARFPDAVTAPHSRTLATTFSQRKPSRAVIRWRSTIHFRRRSK
mgnify:CR=1 FL=1